MTRTEILKKLKEILVNIMPQKENLIKSAEEQTKLVSDLGINSFGLIWLVVVIEETFKVNFENTKMSDFPDVGSIIDFIQSSQI